MSAAILLVLAAVQAVPDTFYNRPGGDADAADIAQRQCRAITTGPAVEGPVLGPPTRLGTSERRTPDGIEDCMIARGWRLYALGPRARRRLQAMRPSARAAALAALRSADRPADSRLLREDRSLRLRRP